jgi:hypothetical protein
VATFSAGELSRARVARRLVALLLILAGVLACGLDLLKVGGSLTDVRLVVTTVFLILGPGWSAAGFLRRAPAAHVWLLAVGVGVSVTLLVGQIMVSTHTWVPSLALYLLTLACIPFLLRHAVVAQ